MNPDKPQEEARFLTMEVSGQKAEKNSVPQKRDSQPPASVAANLCVRLKDKKDANCIDFMMC